MREERAILEAQQVSDEDGIRMVVTFDPYAEFPSEEWGYMPADAIEIFKYHEIRHTISPGGN